MRGWRGGGGLAENCLNLSSRCRAERRFQNALLSGLLQLEVRPALPGIK